MTSTSLVARGSPWVALASEPPIAQITDSASSARAREASARASSSGSVMRPVERGAHRFRIDDPRREPQAMGALALVGVPLPNLRERERVRQNGQRDRAAETLLGAHPSQPLVYLVPGALRRIEGPDLHGQKVARASGGAYGKGRRDSNNAPKIFL